MLIILFLFALIRTLRGIPLPSPGPIPDDFSTLDIRESQNHFGRRTVNDIIISCFATIFACTWKAIHPNIPAPTDCWWTRFKRQVTIMVYSLLVPELITIWALRQRLTAKQIVDDYNKILEELNLPLQEIVDSEKHSDTVKFTNPSVTPTTLKSIPSAILKAAKSISRAILNAVKSIPSAILNAVKPISSAIHALFHDTLRSQYPTAPPQWTLAHGFFLQMGGFMLSKDGRPVHTFYDGILSFGVAADGAFLTEIRSQTIEPPRITEQDIMDRSKGEIISKTITIFQTTWFIIQCIARWTQHLPVTELEVVTFGFASLSFITYMLWWHKPQNVQRPVFLERRRRDHSDEIPSAASGPPDNKILGEEDKEQRWLQQTIRQVRKKYPFLRPIIAPCCVFIAFLRPLSKLGFGDHNNDERIRVPMFHSTDSNQAKTASLIGIPLIGILFGCVHLIPSWFLDFPSLQEMRLWRYSAITITAIPAVIAMIGFTHSQNLRMNVRALNIVIFAGIGLYAVTRIILLVISLTALRSLPSGALQTIEWTTFIPHL